MKPISLAFLFFQLADLLLTRIGLLVGLWEVNPLGLSTEMLISKFLVIGLVLIVFQRLSLPKLAWIIPVISFLVVLWNLLVITVELLYGKL